MQFIATKKITEAGSKLWKGTIDLHWSKNTQSYHNEYVRF